MAKFIKKRNRWYYIIDGYSNNIGFKTKREAEIVALEIELKIMLAHYKRKINE